MRKHRRRNFAKSRNITPRHQTRKFPLSSRLDEFFGRVESVFETGFHYVLEFGVDFLRSPAYSLTVLGHFET